MFREFPLKSVDDLNKLCQGDQVFFLYEKEHGRYYDIISIDIEANETRVRYNVANPIIVNDKPKLWLGVRDLWARQKIRTYKQFITDRF